MKKKNFVHIGSGIMSVLKGNKIINSASSIVIITDDIVTTHWLKPVQKILAGKKILTICIKPGEKYKTLSTLEVIWRKMLLGCTDRSSAVITLGGGVVCDIGGFAAATFMRGIPVIHIPTTLLAQVDASIGGKTAIDFAGIKNSIGVFYESSAVIIDVQTLKTLPKRQIISGMAEIVKHAIIADKGFFDYLSKIQVSEIRDSEWIKIITKSVAIKQKIVEQDSVERNGIRKQLNFGHTVGHAVEALSLMSKKSLLHGEAVAIGIAAETKMSGLTGRISLKEEKLIISTLRRLGLPTKIGGYKLDKIMEVIMKDKKNKEGMLLWSLPTTVGSVESDQSLSINIIKKGISQVLK